MIQSQHRLSLALALSAMLVVACTTPTAQAPTVAPPGRDRGAGGGTGTPIKIGVLNDITGVGAIEGALMRISTELAIQQANATGGINGRPLQAVYVDPKGDATQALQLATQLAQQDNVDVLAGGIFSPECLGVQGLAERLGLVYLPLNGCASQDFTSKSCSRYTFRVYPPDARRPIRRSRIRSRRTATSGRSSIPTTRLASRTWPPAKPRSSAPAASTRSRSRCRWVSRT